MKVEVIKKKGQWYFRVVASNGKILCHSEKYTRRNSCVNAVILLSEGFDIDDILYK